ncbi:hypothetical protein CEXT_508601 [Caerostris extrusa]|uniref:Uncharacterized protein n=1 Tax=Caerostris extrusa TaxID=172846 RepID=A0AAV4XW18_CAEEX|nr:hypothetical protein CEXT_508601 [Caerostris extrusa]
MRLVSGTYWDKKYIKDKVREVETQEKILWVGFSYLDKEKAASFEALPNSAEYNSAEVLGGKKNGMTNLSLSCFQFPVHVLVGSLFGII